MEYFSGSLLNPGVPNGKDNRNKTPFDQYFPDMSRPAPQAGQMSAPRNEAFQLPPILNPSSSYRAFAEPKAASPYMGFIKNLKKGFGTGKPSDGLKFTPPWNRPGFNPSRGGSRTSPPGMPPRADRRQQLIDLIRGNSGNNAERGSLASNPMLANTFFRR